MNQQSGLILLAGDDFDRITLHRIVQHYIGDLDVPDGDVILLHGDPIVGEPCAERFLRAAPFVREVRDRLEAFLEMLDDCEVPFAVFQGDRIVFLVTAVREEHLPLIGKELARERRLLDGLGVDPRDVSVDQEAIAVVVPYPPIGESAWH